MSKYYGRDRVRNQELIVAAADFETRGLGGELLMGQWGLMGEIHTVTGPNIIERFIDFASEYPSPVIWFIHYAQYDWRYFLDAFASGKFDVVCRMRTDNDIYEICFRKKGTKPWVKIRDSYAIWNTSLKDLANRFCPELPKLEIDIENFDITNHTHIAYARRDVEILLVGLPRFFDSIERNFGVTAGATFAGTALRAWQRSLTKTQVYEAQEFDATELYIRQAYYGGLVFLTRNDIVTDCETYDINSSYPAAMCEYGVPDGRTISSVDPDFNRMGIFRVKVRAPKDLVIPILPARDIRGSMRWYGGEFDTVVTNRELIFAAQNGYEILEVFEGIEFEHVIFPFQNFIDSCKSIRKIHKGSGHEHVAKFMQNSCYGKFGTKRERRALYHYSTMESEAPEGAILEPYDENGIWYVAKHVDEEMLCKPSWAVFITAHARLRLLTAAYDIGPENCLYGDTDSLTVKRGFADRISVGPEYGQFKLEKEWREFRAIAPKVYSGILRDGTYKGAAKGLPRRGMNEGHFRSLLENGHAEATTLSLDSLRVAIKQGVRPARELTRRSSDLSNCRNYAVAEGDKVRVKSAT